MRSAATTRTWRRGMHAAPIVAVSRFTAEEVVTRFGVPRERVTVCSPGAPPGPRGRQRMPTVPFCSWAPSSRARTSARCWAPTRDCCSCCRPSRSCCWRAARRPRRRRGSTPFEAAARRSCRTPRLRRTRAALRPLRQSVDAGPALPPRGVRSACPRGHDRRGAGIVSRRGALPEVAGDAGVVVEPNDHAGMAEAMRRFLTDPNAAAAASERGRARARQYSWDTSATALYGASRDAIGRRRGAQR